MPVNFLDLQPRVESEVIPLETASGPVDVELTGLSLSALSDVCKRFPAFRRIIEGGSGSFMEATDAMPAIIAAALGHSGDANYEEKARGFGAADMLAMVRAVMRLTLPTAENTSPLPAAIVNGADDAAQPSLPP